MPILQERDVRGGYRFSLHFLNGHTILQPADLFPSIMSTPLNPRALESLIEHFTSDKRVVPLSEHEAAGAPLLEDSMMLQPRLERAAMNQITGGDATLSRYSIWAETLRGVVLNALERFSSAKVKCRSQTALTGAMIVAALNWIFAPSSIDLLAVPGKPVSITASPLRRTNAGPPLMPPKKTL